MKEVKSQTNVFLGQLKDHWKTAKQHAAKDKEVQAIIDNSNDEHAKQDRTKNIYINEINDNRTSRGICNNKRAGLHRRAFRPQHPYH